MNENKQIAINSLILYLRLIITSIIGLIISRFVLESLGTSDFGLYSVVGGIVVMLNILNTAMMSTTYRFIAFEIGNIKNGNPNKIFNISLILHVFFSVLILIFGEIIGSYYVYNHLKIESAQYSDAMFVLRISIWSSVINMISTPFQGLLIALEKFSITSSIEVLTAFIKLGFVFLLLNYTGNNLRFYSISMLIVIIVTVSLYTLYCYIYYIDIVKFKFYYDWSKYKELLLFSSWILLGATSSLCKTQGAAIIVNYFFGTILNAAYGIANQLNSFVLMFTKNITSAAIPQITKSYSKGDSNRSVEIVAYISKYSFFLMLIPALPILLQTELLLQLWLINIPPFTILFVQLMIIDALIGCLGSGIPALIQATGRIKVFQFSLSFLSLAALPISYIFFENKYPPYSILIIFCIMSLGERLISLYLLRKLLNFDIKSFTKFSYLRIFYVIISLSPLLFLNKLTQGIPSKILLLFISEVTLLIVIYLVGMTNKERLILTNSFNLSKIWKK